MELIRCKCKLVLYQIKRDCPQSLFVFDRRRILKIDFRCGFHPLFNFKIL